MFGLNKKKTTTMAATPKSLEEIEKKNNTIPEASSALKIANQTFRIAIADALRETLKAGFVRMKLNVSEACQSEVERLADELEKKGYVVNFTNQIKTNKGYTQRTMVVNFENAVTPRLKVKNVVPSSEL